MNIQRVLLSAIVFAAPSALMMAQPKGPGGPPRPNLSVTSSAWPDGGEVPMKYSGRGDNKSPDFEFHWNLGAQHNPDTGQRANLRGDFSRCREFHQQNDRRHPPLDRLQYSRQRQRITRRFGHRGSSRRYAQWSRHRRTARNARLLRTRSGPRADPSLRIRVLCSGYQAGSTGQHHA